MIKLQSILCAGVAVFLSACSGGAYQGYSSEFSQQRGVNSGDAYSYGVDMASAPTMLVYSVPAHEVESGLGRYQGDAIGQASRVAPLQFQAEGLNGYESPYKAHFQGGLGDRLGSGRFARGGDGRSVSSRYPVYGTLADKAWSYQGY